ncbi:hypothetical protein ACFP47_11590 [Nesterenkonia lacusekhoensis]|uniref:LPXTG cell wall anchor domain-containing protein n=1 Tax=Nesterenkonia lacusekhoensis TaxID=150832 RepID=A0ABS4T4Q8_9MICC|nr:hypothetical protein [Nesterenkonia lacusekhoensis]MBP2319115.1 hypothetical protein [Nesterenkonia lacusekhoensis]
MTENEHKHRTDAVDEDNEVDEDKERVRRQSSGDMGTVWWFIAATFAFILPENFGAGETIQSIGWWSGIVLMLIGAVFFVRDLRRKR